jgi:hypothetical protein
VHLRAGSRHSLRYQVSNTSTPACLRCRNMVHLAARMFVLGKYSSASGFLRTWLPFAVLAAVCGYFGRLIFLWAWLGVVGLLLGWFLLYVHVARRWSH